MTIASDRWIRAQCMGDYAYELFYDDVSKGTYSIDNFASDRDELPAIKSLKVGEEHVFKNGNTKISVKCIETLPTNREPLIHPFISESRKHIDIDIDGAKRSVKCPSFGLSSFGYDIRVDRRFTTFRKSELKLDSFHQHLLDTDAPLSIHDPANWQRYAEEKVIHTVSHPDNLPIEEYTQSVEADYIDIPANGFILGVAMERICMPANVTAVCMAKSTLARMGLVAYVTPVEAGWSGFLTVEISNFSPNTIRLYAGVGIMQLLFHIGEEKCMVSYADRAGKYQDQPNVPIIGTM